MSEFNFFLTDEGLAAEQVVVPSDDTDNKADEDAFGEGEVMDTVKICAKRNKLPTGG